MKNNDRLPKQLGDFGEQLVMFIIGRLYKHRVAYVDHVGADLIATDGEKNMQSQLNQGFLQLMDHNNHLTKINKIN